MPYFDEGEVETPDVEAVTLPIDMQSHRAANQSFFGTAATAVGYALGSVVDLADTVVSSVPGVSAVTGAERGSVNNALLRAIDSPGLTQFYEQNKAGLEVGSGIAGVIGAELLTRRFTAPASAVMQTLRKTPYLRRAAILDDQYESALAAAKLTDMAVARRGLMGADQYTASARVARDVFDSTTGVFVSQTQNLARNQIVRQAKTLGAAVGARNAAVTEAIAAVTLNQNGFLFFDSVGANTAFAALGLGLGGGIGALGASYSIRKAANSDMVRRAFAGALDPEMAEGSRLTWGQRTFTSPRTTGELQPGDFLAGSITDKATALQVEAVRLRELPAANTDDPVTLLSQRAQLATQKEDLARQELQKATIKGISSDGRSRFSLDAPEYGNHADMVFRRDPTAFNGAEMIGGVHPETTIHAVVEVEEKRLAARIADTQNIIDSILEKAASGKTLKPKELKELADAQLMMLRLEYQGTLTPMAIVDGEYMPISEAIAFEGFTPIQPRKTDLAMNEIDPDSGTATRIWDVKSEAPGLGVSLDDQFVLKLPGAKTLDNADHYDIMHAYKLAQTALRSMSQNLATPVILPKNPTWFQLDMAEELLRLTNGAADVRFPGQMTRESAQVESLIQKTEALNKHWFTRESLAKHSQGIDYEGNLSKLRLRYNLPRLTAYERGLLGSQDHPIDFLMRGINSYSPQAARNLTLDEVKEGVAQARRLGDLTPVTKNDVSSLYGSSFKMLQDEKGNPIQPLIVYKRPFQVQDWTLDDLSDRLAARKMRTLTTLTNAESEEFTRNLTQSLTQSSDFQLASRTDELMDIQIQGSILGAAPQTPQGAWPKVFKTSEWIARDTPILLAAGRIRDQAGRLTRDFMKATIEKNFGDKLSVLANPRNAASRLLLNQFHSFRSAWDLHVKPVDMGNGYWGFRLADTERNERLWKAIHGTEFKAGAFLQSPDGKNVVLDSLGLDVQKAYNRVTDQIIDAKNTLLRSMGRGEIKKQQWFTPNPQTDGKLIGFVLGPDNKTVPGMTIIADTAEAFAKGREEIYARLNAMGAAGVGYRFTTQDEIRRFADIWDRVEMDFINPATTAVQPGKKGAGKLTGPTTRLNAFENSMTYLQDQFLRHGGDVVEQLFKEQIQSSKMRAIMASPQTRNAQKTERYRSIYDMYVESLLGTSKLNHEGSQLGWAWRGAERKIDAILESTAPKATRAWAATTEFLGRHRIWDRSPEGASEFDRLTRELGQYMPFENAIKLMEAKKAGTTPPTLAGITGKMNQLSAGLMLRFMETAHPIMNLTGIINAAPAVLRNMQPRVGETTEAFAARIGHSAQIFNVNGQVVAIPDIIKLTNRAVKRAWNRASDADYKFMVQRGYLSQEVAEFQRQFAAIEGKDHGKIRTAFDKMIHYGSFLSDRSEDFSRSWGHFIGLELADNLGIVGRESRHSFAHDVANKMIANYDPHNRPEIFQGALGAPLGLFQSFAQNYYQKLFRYVETGDLRAFATQYATQSALFGVTGLAGWDQMNALMQRLDRDSDATTGVQSRIPNTFGDIVAHGIISNIPQLFGGEGVDLYSRGDTSFRVPGVGDQSIPGMAIGSKIYEGLTAAFQAFASEHSTLTGTQIAEVMSNMVVNRPLSGMIEQFLAHGNDTDAYAQLVSDTKGMLETTYRIMGVRSQRQSEELAAFYADKGIQEHQAAVKDILRTSTRAALRAGRLDKIPDIYERYLKSGGDPTHFRRWIKEQTIAATETRSTRALDKLLKSKNPDMDRIDRYLDLGVTVDQEARAGNIEELYGYVDELEQNTQLEPEFSGQMTIDPYGYDGESEP